MNVVITILAVFFITFVGYVVLKGGSFLPKKNTLFLIGLGYGLGVGLISAQMYLLTRFGFAWSVYNLIFPWVCIIAGVFFSQRKRFALQVPIYKNRDTIIVVLLIGILFCVFYTVFEALIRPLTVWDGWAAWMMKAKAFYLDRAITLPTLQYIRSDGPLVISLLGSCIYILLGQIDDTAVLLTSSAFYISLLILFYAALRERYAPRYALFFTFLLAATQTLIRQGGRIEAGQADLALGYYIFICTLLFLTYWKSVHIRTLLLVTLFVSITTFIKIDAMPFALLMILLIAFTIFLKKKYSHGFVLLLWLLPVLEWQYFKKLAQLDGIYYEGHGIVFSLTKILRATTGSIQALVNVKSWNLLWFVYFYCLFFLFPRKNTELVFLHIVIVSQLGIYLLIYFFTAGNAPESSSERLLTHLAPLALYTIALSIHRDLL